MADSDTLWCDCAAAVVPLLDVGLAPFAQWIVVPLAALWLLARLKRARASEELKR